VVETGRAPSLPVRKRDARYIGPCPIRDNMLVENGIVPRPRPVGDGMWGVREHIPSRWDGVPAGSDVSTNMLSLTGHCRDAA
jgi:hypothetical protein